MYFAEGFFGPHWATDGSAQLEIISEDAQRGGDTLTPGDTCLKYRTDVLGHDFGYLMLGQWQDVFAAPISERYERRLGHDPHPAGCLRHDGNVRLRDSGTRLQLLVQYLYTTRMARVRVRKGFATLLQSRTGNPYGPAMGWLYLNATADLLMKPKANNVYFSFVHDGRFGPLASCLAAPRRANSGTRFTY